MLFFALPSDIARIFDEIDETAGIKALEQLLDATELDKGPDHAETLETVNSLGGLLAQAGDMKRAEALFRRALVGREKTLGPDSPETEISLCNLGCVLMNSENFRGSLEFNLRLKECRERRLPADHPGIACALIDLGFAYKALGEFGKAEPMYSRAVEIAEKEMPPGSNDLANALQGLAETMMALKRFEDALPLLLRALENRLLSTNPDPFATMSLYTSLGCVLDLSGDSRNARKAWRDALREAKLYGISESLAASFIELALGQSLVEAEQLAKAIKHLGKAASGFRTALGPEHARTIAAENRLEDATLMHWIRDRGLIRLLAPGLTHADVAKGLKKAGPPESVRLRFLGLRWLSTRFGGPGMPCPDMPPPPDGIEAGGHAGGPGAFPPHGSPGNAVRNAQALLAARKRELKPGHEDTVKAEVALGNALLADGRPADAADAFASARAAAVKSFGRDSPAAQGADYCLREAEFRKVIPASG
jgi:tetratricopeptide (TPR) repeat protein